MSAVAQHVQFRQYAQDRGLLNLGIQCLEQDRSGFIIICSEDGVYRFDGREFTAFGADQGLPSRGIAYDVKLAPNGRTFVAFSDAVYVSEPPSPSRGPARFVQATTVDGPVELNSPHRTALLGNDMLMVERDRLSIVRGHPGRPPTIAPYFDAAALAAHPQLAKIVSIAVTTDGIWLGCGDGAVCHVPCDAKSCRPATIFDAGSGLPAQEWAAFLRDKDGTLWVRSLDLLAHQSPGSNRFVVESVPGGSGRYAGHADRLVLTQDTAGRMVTQGPAGLLLRDNGGWTGMDRTQGLPEGEIVSIMVDRENSLWLGIRDQGLFRGIGTGRWENWTRNEGLADNVIWQMSRADGNPLWVASEAGVDAVPQTVLPGSTAGRLPGSSFALATTRMGRVWRSTVDGHVSRFDPATGREDAVATLPTVVEMFNGGDVLWIGTRSGLYQVPRPDSDQPNRPVKVPGVNAWIRNVIGDREGGAWVATPCALIHVDHDMISRVVIDRAHGLIGAIRTVAIGADGDIWIGSGIFGVQKLHMRDGRVVAMEPITMPAIASNNVLLLHGDRRGWMWLGSDRGLDVWNGRVWHHLDEEDGLLSDDIDEGSFFEDRDNSMWFGTGHGLSHLLDPAPIFTSLPLHPIVTSVQFGGRPLTTDRINWSHDPLTVRFSALDFRDERSIRFRYRLTGVDRDWVVTEQNEVRYPQLPAGKLVFSVQAIDPLKQRNSIPVSFTLHVRAPWWWTWWFLLLCALTVVAMITSLWRLRVRYLLLRQHLLEELVAERTAEIESARAALFEQATRDSLTGLLNRPAIMQAFELCIGAAARARAANTDPLTVALIDLDHFKSVNDRFGHLGGDEVLREVARRLIEALHPTEQAGRYGGEELIVLIPSRNRPELRVRALRDAMFSTPIAVDSHVVSMTCSIGVARYRPGDSKETLLRRADECLYIAKNDGRDRIAFES